MQPILRGRTIIPWNFTARSPTVFIRERSANGPGCRTASVSGGCLDRRGSPRARQCHAHIPRLRFLRPPVQGLGRPGRPQGQVFPVRRGPERPRRRGGGAAELKGRRRDDGREESAPARTEGRQQGGLVIGLAVGCGVLAVLLIGGGILLFVFFRGVGGSSTAPTRRKRTSTRSRRA